VHILNLSCLVSSVDGKLREARDGSLVMSVVTPASHFSHKWLGCLQTSAGFWKCMVSLNVEWYWLGSKEMQGEQSVPVTLCTSQIPYGLVSDVTWLYLVTGRWRTDRHMARRLKHLEHSGNHMNHRRERSGNQWTIWLNTLVTIWTTGENGVVTNEPFDLTYW